MNWWNTNLISLWTPSGPHSDTHHCSHTNKTQAVTCYTHTHTDTHSTLYSRYKPCIHQVRWEEVTRGCETFTWCHLIYYTLYKKKEASYEISHSSCPEIFIIVDKVLFWRDYFTSFKVWQDLYWFLKSIQWFASFKFWPLHVKKKSWDRSRGYDLLHERSFFFPSDHVLSVTAKGIKSC